MSATGLATPERARRWQVLIHRVLMPEMAEPSGIQVRKFLECGCREAALIAYLGVASKGIYTPLLLKGLYWFCWQTIMARTVE